MAFLEPFSKSQTQNVLPTSGKICQYIAFNSYQNCICTVFSEKLGRSPGTLDGRTRKFQFVRTAFFVCSDAVYWQLVVFGAFLEPPHRFWQKAPVLSSWTCKKPIARLELSVFQCKDCSVMPCSRLYAVFGVVSDFGNRFAVDFDSEGFAESVHCLRGYKDGGTKVAGDRWVSADQYWAGCLEARQAYWPCWCCVS